MACQYLPPWYLRVMFDLWMSIFDVGTVLLPARKLYTFSLLSYKCKNSHFAGWIAPKPLIFAIWEPWYDKI